MKRFIPDEKYEGLPCSVVAVGCAYDDTLSCLGLKATSEGLQGLMSPELKEDGYLSLDGMNRLIRANLGVKRKVSFKRGQRPTLAEYVHMNHKHAVVCVRGHYVYTDGVDYWSYFWNGQDEVICAWELT